MSLAAPPVVEGAPRVALPYGLFSVLSTRTAGDNRWENGVTWEALTCAPISGIGPDCTSPLGLPKVFTQGLLLGTATPFVVYGTYKCSPIGHSLAEGQSFATQKLLAREEARAERAFWTGDLNNTPNLVTGAATLGGGVVNASLALGLLEDYIADTYGSLGVIHVDRSGFITLAQNGKITTNGSRATTIAGTPVVAGAGYPGTSPAGAAPASGTSWAYASPALFGYRSEIFPSSNQEGDLLDRGNNNLYAIAERAYLIGFDACGTGAVNFTLGCC